MADYDPQERRERYLRTRQLKGRPTGTASISALRKPGSGVTTKTTVKAPAAATKTSATTKSVTEQKIEKMKVRLKKLRETITRLVAEVQELNGIESASKSNESSKAKTSDTKLTAKQKADAAKRAKESYEKNKDPSTDQQIEAIQKQIDSAVERIQDLKKKAAEARKNPKSTSFSAKPKSTAFSGKLSAKGRQTVGPTKK